MGNGALATGDTAANTLPPHLIGTPAAQVEAHPNGSRRRAGALKSFTGCVSEISSCEHPGHSYTDALRNYAEVYEAYQAYLTPEAVPHNYDLVGVAEAGSPHIGCLNEELMASTLQADTVSDDDIERCGYLGWLQHR